MRGGHGGRGVMAGRFSRFLSLYYVSSSLPKFKKLHTYRMLVVRTRKDARSLHQA
jgi:hypothetical protein